MKNHFLCLEMDVDRYQPTSLNVGCQKGRYCLFLNIWRWKQLQWHTVTARYTLTHWGIILQDFKQKGRKTLESVAISVENEDKRYE